MPLMSTVSIPIRLLPSGLFVRCCPLRPLAEPIPPDRAPCARAEADLLVAAAHAPQAVAADSLQTGPPAATSGHTELVDGAGSLIVRAMRAFADVLTRGRAVEAPQTDRPLGRQVSARLPSGLRNSALARGSGHSGTADDPLARWDWLCRRPHRYTAIRGSAHPSASAGMERRALVACSARTSSGSALSHCSGVLPWMA